MTKNAIIKIIIDFIILVACILIAYNLSNWMFYKIRISGPSMEPTIHNEDYVILYKPGKYKRGDVVVFKIGGMGDNGADGKYKYYVKRIIAIEGDSVEIKEDAEGEIRIFVNDEAIEEDYLGEGVPYARPVDKLEKMVVPDGKFFFCGDNRNNSNDSRTGDLFGNLDGIVGRVILRYEPSGKNMELIKRPYSIELFPESVASFDKFCIA